jgi:hypothetical protein
VTGLHALSEFALSHGTPEVVAGLLPKTHFLKVPPLSLDAAMKSKAVVVVLDEKD